MNCFVIIRKIERLECSLTGYLRFNLLCEFEDGKFRYIRNRLNNELIKKFCNLKVGDFIHVLIHVPFDYEWFSLDDKPDFICDDIFTL